MSVLQNVLGAIVSLFSTDVVAIYNDSEDQVFSDSIPMKASVNPQVKSFEHPLETSVVVTDHRVLLPIEIRIQMIIPDGQYVEVYKDIRQAFENADIFSIQTKVDIFDNMLLVGIPHEEDPDKFDAITIELSFKETQFANLTIVTLPADQVSDPTQSSLIDRGVQNAKAATGSIGTRLFDTAAGFF